METKLTLKLDKDVIEEVKRYAKKRNVSLSKMVERYFQSLIDKKRPKKRKYTALVEELSGVITLDKDFDHREAYGDYLIEKYQ